MRQESSRRHASARALDARGFKDSNRAAGNSRRTAGSPTGSSKAFSAGRGFQNRRQQAPARLLNRSTSNGQQESRQLQETGSESATEGVTASAVAALTTRARAQQRQALPGTLPADTAAARAAFSGKKGRNTAKAGGDFVLQGQGRRAPLQESRDWLTDEEEEEQTHYHMAFGSRSPSPAPLRDTLDGVTAEADVLRQSAFPPLGAASSLAHSSALLSTTDADISLDEEAGTTDAEAGISSDGGSDDALFSEDDDWELASLEDEAGWEIV